MSLSNMQVFSKYYQPAIIETLAYMVDKFNSASAGAIRLTTEGFRGRLHPNSFYSALHSAQRRDGRYATNADATPTTLAQVKDSGVKIAGGFGPILFEPSQLGWLQKPNSEAVAAISQNFAEAMLKDQLYSAIAALVAAIANQSTAKNDVSATAGLSYNAINDAHAKFGDHSGKHRRQRDGRRGLSQADRSEPDQRARTSSR